MSRGSFLHSVLNQRRKCIPCGLAPPGNMSGECFFSSCGSEQEPDDDDVLKCKKAGIDKETLELLTKQDLILLMGLQPHGNQTEAKKLLLIKMMRAQSKKKGQNAEKDEDLSSVSSF